VSKKKTTPKQSTAASRIFAIGTVAASFVFAATYEIPRTAEAKAVTKKSEFQDDAVKDAYTLASETCPKYGVPSLFVATIIDKESGGRPDAIRFEKSQMERAKKITRNSSEQTMYASSIGPMQVMGWWAPQFGMTWNDLVDVRTNVEVSCRIMAQCMSQARGAKSEKFRQAAKCYNGSGPQAEKYADNFMRRLTAKALDSLPPS
jgi:soluble lytic murein transglycosylase-like protein